MIEYNKLISLSLAVEYRRLALVIYFKFLYPKFKFYEKFNDNEEYSCHNKKDNVILLVLER